MLAETELTGPQWQIADAIARQLVLDGTDVNELQKAIAYLRSIVSEENAGKRFFDYLKTLVRHGKTIGHSKRTEGYYSSLDEVCSHYLTDYQDDIFKLLYLLGWVARLAKYYKDGSPVGELKVPEIKTKREAELIAMLETHKFAVGQKMQALITNIKGSKVTYELLETIRLTVKEPKKAGIFEENQTIDIEITQLKEDGSIKKVKAIG